MFCNGMHAALFIYCKLLLYKELVLPYQVTLNDVKRRYNRKKWTYPNLSVSVSNFSISVLFQFFVIFSFPFSFPLTESKFFS